MTPSASGMTHSVALSAAKDLIAASNRHEILRCAQDDREGGLFVP
jgi:hypothetical protein